MSSSSFSSRALHTTAWYPFSAKPWGGGSNRCGGLSGCGGTLTPLAGAAGGMRNCTDCEAVGPCCATEGPCTRTPGFCTTIASTVGATFFGRYERLTQETLGGEALELRSTAFHCTKRAGGQFTFSPRPLE